MMEKFYKDFGFVIGFMVIVLIWNMGFGSKATQYMLLLVLAGMLVLNAADMTKFLENTFTFKENSDEEENKNESGN